MAGVLLIVAWQLAIGLGEQPESYRLRAASGIHAEQKFVYFLYYLNQFPVATTKSGRDLKFYFSNQDVPTEPSTLRYAPEEARRIFAEEGSTLVTEWGHTTRGGNLLRTYLYLLHAWRLGSPEHAEMRFTHYHVFVAALVGVYVGFWWVGLPLLGLVLVVFLGSNPFQLYEAYWRENVFSWPITTFCIVLSLSLPLLAGSRAPRPYVLAAPVVTGLLLATTNQIRSESSVMLLAALFAYVTAGGLAWRARWLAVGLLAVSFAAGLVAWGAYFDAKIRAATTRVAAAGGHPYLGPRDRDHGFWHSVWCGLGDFDDKYGYNWKDHVAIAYAQPILEAQHRESLPWWWGVRGRFERGRTADDYHDAARIYYRVPWEVPHYAAVLREKALHDIVHDPLWYLGILARRAGRILHQTTPVRVYVRSLLDVTLPFHGALVFVVSVVAAAAGGWFLLRLLVFSLAPSLVALGIYSGGNMTYYGVYHLVAAALVMSWLVEIVLALAGRRATTRAVSSA